ncbi:MAG: DUF4910 domain-containing protein [Aequorivita sp.]
MKKKLETYFDRLWPITRSLTGDGNRESLKILSEIIDLKLTEVPSGTACFDWEVPPEWNIKAAWIKDSKGQVIVNMAENNLHILGYSEAFNGKMNFEELEPHLYTLPDQPELIPYMTSYYKRRWGFCMAHEQFLKLDKSETYEVFIDSSLDKNGSMTVGEAVIEGKSKQEVLFSTYICHPSMANNELSGPLVMALIYSELRKQKNLKYTYRFLFAPETIGALYNLSVYGTHWKKNLKAGYVVNCVGDPGNFTYKKSRIGNSLADRTAAIVLKQTEADYEIIDFAPLGSDERQYCSPGFNLPVGSLMRTKHSTYPEYHTSADNKDFISFGAMQETVLKYLEMIQVLEWNSHYLNTLPYGEPQLGKRGLYPTLSKKGERAFVDAMMWVLNLSDGEYDLIAISERSKIPIKELIPVVEILLKKKILQASGNFKEDDSL